MRWRPFRVSVWGLGFGFGPRKAAMQQRRLTLTHAVPSSFLPPDSSPLVGVPRARCSRPSSRLPWTPSCLREPTSTCHAQPSSPRWSFSSASCRPSWGAEPVPRGDRGKVRFIFQISTFSLLCDVVEIKLGSVKNALQDYYNYNYRCIFQKANTVFNLSPFILLTYIVDMHTRDLMR